MLLFFVCLKKASLTPCFSIGSTSKRKDTRHKAPLLCITLFPGPLNSSKKKLLPVTAVNGWHKLSSPNFPFYSAAISDAMPNSRLPQRKENICTLTGSQCSISLKFNTETHLVFAGYFWNYFGYSSFKVFYADVFKDDSSLRQQSYICCNFFTLKAQNQSNSPKEVIKTIRSFSY